MILDTLSLHSSALGGYINFVFRIYGVSLVETPEIVNPLSLAYFI